MSRVTYSSSRSPGVSPVPFREALLRGLAPDGGLYLPDTIPTLPDDWEEHDAFEDLATSVLSRWIEEPDEDELRRLLTLALDFPVPVVPLGDERYVVELFHGPTLSFKDFGARTMARLMDHYLARRGEKLTILVATSGDTGSAVADGFSGLTNLDVVLLYPKGLVSEVQERQLTAARPGLTSLRVRGTFDDCQRMVKESFADPRLAELPLSSANSINVGRLLPQQLYYVWALAWLRRQAGSEAVVSVPSGNLGNLTAGLLAAAGGLPAGPFLAAHNANDFFPRFLAGSARAFDFKETVATVSNAMDVGAPSNFERLHRLFGDTLRSRVWGCGVDDDTTRLRMKRTHEVDGYVACPHTAVGLEAVDRYRQASGDSRPALILATAHPAKFPKTVRAALGGEPPTSARLEELLGRRHEVTDIDASSDELREVLLQPSR